MSLVIHEDLTVAIPETIAEAFGLHAGRHVDRRRTEDGTLTLRPANEHVEAFDRFREILTGTLRPGENGSEEFLKWRQEERELDLAYHQW